MRPLWSLACIVGFTLWHALRASVAALVGVPDRPGGVYDREPRDGARRLISAAGLPVSGEGLENLEPERPYVFAANHAFIPIVTRSTNYRSSILPVTAGLSAGFAWSNRN